MFGKPSISKEYAGIIRQLDSGDRRPAQHLRPTTVTAKGFDSFATPGVQAVFEGFDYFGALMNQQIAEPWTVEETDDTRVKDLHSDGPMLGRTYLLFFNAMRVGRLQVTEGFNADGFRKDVAWHQENRAGLVLVDIDYLRFIPYDDALSLINAVELFVGRFDDNDAARQRAKLNASAALTGYLWEAMRAGDEYVPSFSHRVDGPYDLLHRTTEHWKAGGVDPFERWNGDRLQ